MVEPVNTSSFPVGSVLSVYDGLNPATMSGNLLLASGNLDEIFAQVTSSATTSYLRDGINSGVASTSSGGSITGSSYYSPYGDSAQTGTGATPFQFTGRENDGATGLYYYRARYYSPPLGRFISEDPLGLSAGTWSTQDSVDT
jgi:RHS repeat-associated protein